MPPPVRRDLLPEVPLHGISDMQVTRDIHEIDATTFGDPGPRYHYIEGRHEFRLVLREFPWEITNSHQVLLAGRLMQVLRADVETPYNGPIQANLTLTPAEEAPSATWMDEVMRRGAPLPQPLPDPPTARHLARFDQALTRISRSFVSLGDAGRAAQEAMTSLDNQMREFISAGTNVMPSPADIPAGRFLAIGPDGRTVRQAQEGDTVIGVSLGDGRMQVYGPAQVPVQARLRAAAERLRAGSAAQPAIEPEPVSRSSRRFTLDEDE